MLYRIVAPHFVAGLIADGNKVIKAAPIIAYSYKMGVPQFLKYCQRKGWKVELIHD